MDKLCLNIYNCNWLKILNLVEIVFGNLQGVLCKNKQKCCRNFYKKKFKCLSSSNTSYSVSIRNTGKGCYRNSKTSSIFQFLGNLSWNNSTTRSTYINLFTYLNLPMPRYNFFLKNLAYLGTLSFNSIKGRLTSNILNKFRKLTNSSSSRFAFLLVLKGMEHLQW